MFKRARWMAVGFTAGVGSSYAIARRVRRTIVRYTPTEVVGRTASHARSAGQSVRAAAAEGRAEMRAREAQLRAAVDRGPRAG